MVTYIKGVQFEVKKKENTFFFFSPARQKWIPISESFVVLL